MDRCDTFAVGLFSTAQTPRLPRIRIVRYTWFGAPPETILTIGEVIVMQVKKARLSIFAGLIFVSGAVPNLATMQLFICLKNDALKSRERPRADFHQSLIQAESMQKFKVDSIEPAALL
jgi:hypothetical protein